MKKITFTILIMFVSMLTVFADNRQEALDFYNSYINAANSYSNDVTKMYSPSAKIIRQVVKPDGSTVNVYKIGRAHV